MLYTPEHTTYFENCKYHTISRWRWIKAEIDHGNQEADEKWDQICDCSHDVFRITAPSLIRTLIQSGQTWSIYQTGWLKSLKQFGKS